MAVSLEQDELRLASLLQEKGLSRSSAVLAVVMVTRAHARPEDELVEIVRQYPGLETTWDAKTAIKDLRARGWLHVSGSYNSELVHQAADLRDKIASEAGNPDISNQLLKMRANLEPYVSVIGAMNDKLVYSTFMSLLRNAQQSVCLPMLATTPYDETVQILQDRARAGVRIRILLGTPSLVAKWRGETMRSISESRIARWGELFRGYSTVEIRLSRDSEDMALATSVAIDENIVRLDVYDPQVQRSLEGVMIEIASPQGLQLNLNRIFHRLFEEAWSRSLPLGKLASLRYSLRRWWKVWLGSIFTALAFLPVPAQNWAEIMIGIGGGILATTLIEEGPNAWNWIRGR